MPRSSIQGCMQVRGSVHGTMCTCSRLLQLWLGLCHVQSGQCCLASSKCITCTKTAASCHLRATLPRAAPRCRPLTAKSEQP